MGSWFSNIHINKNGTVTNESVTQYVSRLITEQHYLPCDCKNDADGGFAILSSKNSQWFTICSDLISFEDPKVFDEIALSMSAELHTQILSIACFDSDYLYLNLVDANDNTNAWIGIGSASGLGIRRRSCLSAWRNKVLNFPDFSSAEKEKYVFAENFLEKAQNCLSLPKECSTVNYDYLNEDECDAKFYYFKLPADLKTKEPPKLIPYLPSLMPCFLESPNIVSGINVGDESRGLSVYFLGSYVENDEITFSDVCFVKMKKYDAVSIPFQLSKIQLSDGQWAYYYHDPGFRIPGKIDPNLPLSKQMRLENERNITVRFIPHGEHKKILDITVALVPDKNPRGDVVWNVLQRFASKKEYIEYHNNNWKKYPNYEHLLLQEEDFI